jgi:hypothetical protein
MSKRMSGRAEAARIGEATDYLCDDGCCVDLNGYARGSQAALIAPLPADVSDDNVTKAWWGDCWRDSGALLPLLVRRLLRREHRPLPQNHLGGWVKFELPTGSVSPCR